MTPEVEELLRAIRRAIKDVEDRVTGPYGAMESIESAIRDFEEDIEDEQAVPGSAAEDDGA